MNSLKKGSSMEYGMMSRFAEALGLAEKAKVRELLPIEAELLANETRLRSVEAELQLAKTELQAELEKLDREKARADKLAMALGYLTLKLQDTKSALKRAQARIAELEQNQTTT